jgi:hypothetical protein
MLSSSSADAGRAVHAGKFALVSRGPVSLPDDALGFHNGLLVRDPDGHAVQIVRK